ncbi:hypothetical protein FRC04_003642 [Tulasnella sp. 424]|nr:hypothetical protein FRC04_003642 [Tulasnella sp. 424]
MAQVPVQSPNLPDDKADSSFSKDATSRSGSQSDGQSPGAGGTSSSSRNATSVDLLPEEILIEVVRLCLGPDKPLGDLSGLTCVCRRWKIILEGAPSLWSRISAAERSPLVRKALQLAGSVPLDLAYSERGLEAVRGTFFNEIRGSTGRWRSLVAEFDGWMASPLINLLSTPAPKLISLRLVNSFVHLMNASTITLFGGAPASSSLKDLCISWIPIAVAPLQLSHLESLTLGGIGTVSALDIIRIIVDSPALQVLHLVSLKGLSQQDPLATLPAHTAVRLSSLRDLLLDDVPPSFIRFLLSIIDSPNLHSMQLACDVAGQMTSEILTQDIFHLIPLLTSMTANAQEIIVSLSGYYHYKISVGRFALGGWMEEPPTNHVSSAVEWICSHLGRHLRDIPVHLSIHDSDPQIEYLESFNPGLRVTNLSLWSDPHFGPPLEEFIPFLSRPTTTLPGGWILPHLEVIEANLVLDDGNSDLIDLARHRYDASTAGAETESEVVVPKRLREMRLATGKKYMDPDAPPNSAFMLALHEAGNGVDVFWHGAKWVGN